GIRSSIDVFISALPNDSRQYVCDSTMGSFKQTPGSPPDLSDCDTLSLSLQESSSGSEVCVVEIDDGLSQLASHVPTAIVRAPSVPIVPGMIHTEDACVIAFVGVTSKGSVPAAEYIKDLVILLRVIDTVIRGHPAGIEKVKGTEGSIILRFSREREGERERERERADMGIGSEGSLTVPGLSGVEVVTNKQKERHRECSDCRAMCMFCLLVMQTPSYIRQQGIPLDTIEGIRAGICCGPVTGGVLGAYELMYDVFGDTVNMAA
ncbi:hypothetical protein KIPB_011507, partial [Kipferlia bialata]